jgi:solute carrier family 35 protein F5
MWRSGVRGLRSDVQQIIMEFRQGRNGHKTIAEDDENSVAGERLLMSEAGSAGALEESNERLNFRETLVLSAEFCLLWFLANYFASACLEYTSVASVTILNSTSSVWTLILGSFFGIEPFTLRKLIGVLASFAGVVLISTVDLSGKADDDTGSFPHKTPAQTAIGDGMAIIGALLYGMYITVMKRRVGNEERVDMRLFFGLVGLLSLLFLWPLFFILHWTGIEPVRHRSFFMCFGISFTDQKMQFELPPTSSVWIIVIVGVPSASQSCVRY